jgi:hypothetical protein
MNSNNKLKVCEYFDNLINRLDLVVETLISKSSDDPGLVDKFNKQRDEFLKEIRDVEAFNLRSTSGMHIKLGEVLTEQELFPKFCFFVEHAREKVDLEIGLRLIVSDKFLSEGQIKSYETFFNCILKGRSPFSRLQMMFLPTIRFNVNR